MHNAQVDALRALLAPTGWLDRTRQFAGALRHRARTPQGLLIVGTPHDYYRGRSFRQPVIDITASINRKAEPV